MKVGDVFENRREGVKGTDIPVGAVVSYEIGIDRGRFPFTVVDVPGIGKMLCVGDTPQERVGECSPNNCIHGQSSPMTIVSLPNT